MTTQQKVIINGIKKRGLDYEYVCEKLGIEQVKFLNYLNKKTDLNSAEFLALCLFLNLNLNDFERPCCV